MPIITQPHRDVEMAQIPRGLVITTYESSNTVMDLMSMLKQKESITNSRTTGAFKKYRNTTLQRAMEDCLLQVLPPTPSRECRLIWPRLCAPLSPGHQPAVRAPPWGAAWWAAWTHGGGSCPGRSASGSRDATRAEPPSSTSAGWSAPRTALRGAEAQSGHSLSRRCYYPKGVGQCEWL